MRRGITFEGGDSVSNQSGSAVTEDLALIQRQVNDLTDLLEYKDQELDEIRGDIRRERQAYNSLSSEVTSVQSSVQNLKNAKKGIIRGSNDSEIGSYLDRKNRKAGVKSHYDDEYRSVSSNASRSLRSRLSDRLYLKEESRRRRGRSLRSNEIDEGREEGYSDDENDSNEDDESEAEVPMIALDEDTFSLMMISPILSVEWVLGILASAFQWTILILIFIDLVTNTKTTFNIPYSVPIEVTAGQFLAIIICVGVQSDVLSSTRLLVAFRYSKETDWDEILGIGEGNGTIIIWFVRVFFPTVLKLLSGVLVLSVNFVTIVQSSNIVDLIKDIAALLIISEITEIFYQLAAFGFLGERLENTCRAVPDTEIEDTMIMSRKICGHSLPARLVVFVFFTVAMSGVVYFLLIEQLNGQLFRQKFPHCTIEKEDIAKFGNGKCDGGILGTVDCDFDGGDCVAFNLEYPNCDAPNPTLLGNKICDNFLNTIECNFDGSDCCPYDDNNGTRDARYGDGQCDGGKYSTKMCYWDDGDCDDFRQEFFMCDLVEISEFFPVESAPRLGDGVCESSLYNNFECGFEAGDCVACNAIVFDPHLTGDGLCHGGLHNSPECNYDAGDCIDFNRRYPRCATIANRIISNLGTFLEYVPIIGDGICNSGLYNNDDCGFEDGDCLLCNELVENVTKVGDGQCDGQNYMSEACGFDGGDCAKCEHPRYEIGNGWCTNEYNTPECGYDGGDCRILTDYPDCSVDEPSLLNNGYCNGAPYNSEVCGWDGGDCSNVTKVCDEQKNFLLGDGTCNAELNTEICGYDGGDCVLFNELYPNCNVPFPNLVGNGWCSSGEPYNTEECLWDGGDCLEE